MAECGPLVTQVPLQPREVTHGPSVQPHGLQNICIGNMIMRGDCILRDIPEIQKNTDLSKHLTSAIPGNPAVLMLSPAKSRAGHSVTYMCMAQSIVGGGKNEG